MDVVRVRKNCLAAEKASFFPEDIREMKGPQSVHVRPSAKGRPYLPITVPPGLLDCCEVARQEQEAK